MAKRNRVVRISSHFYAIAEAYAHKESRTPSAQVQYWANIGKAGLDNPDLPIHFVRDLLMARKEDKNFAKSFVKLIF